MNNFNKYKRLNIFAGHYGSGKTEIAVNFAVCLSRMGLKVAIADLDIINPYFRTADCTAMLESKGIKVVSSMYASTNIDVPVIPQETYGLFEDKTYHVILDIGGDDLGAKAISRFKREILNDDTEFNFVINAKRPFTSNIEEMKEAYISVSESAGIYPSKIVNNTNLMEYTDYKTLIEGERTVEDFSKEIGVEVAFNSMMKTTIKKIDKNDMKNFKYPIFAMEKSLLTPWN